MKSIQRELMELILANREALSLPENLQADFLPTEGDALSFQSDNVPKLAKSYISGTSEYNYAFSILAVTDGSVTSAPNLTAMNWLSALGDLFDGMHNFHLSDTRTIISGETTTPAIITRTQDNRIVYSIQITIRYKET